MGLYAQLLIRYLRVPADALCNSLRDANIDVDMNARPIFLDNRPTEPAALSAPASIAPSHAR